MASKRGTRKEFDWRGYSRPARILDSDQEAAFSSGHLAAILEYAICHSGVAALIRAKQVTLYYLGASLVRVRTSEDGPVAEVDANLRLPPAERSGAETIETLPLRDDRDVANVIGTVDELRQRLDSWSTARERAPIREHLLGFYAQNTGCDAESDELVVADIEYPYGCGRFDFVALRRAVSVGGIEAFTTPGLVLGDLRYAERGLAGSARLADFGSNASELAHALSGEHLERVKAEIKLMVSQRMRLGLLRPDLPFERFAQGDPELLVAFTDPAVADPRFDAPIAELHDKLIARRFPIDRLAFATVGEARENPGAAESAPLAVRREDVLGYRPFKAMRKRRRD